MTCGSCFDEENIGQDVTEEVTEEDEKRGVVAALRRSLSSSSGVRSRATSQSSLSTVTSIVTVAALREELATLAEEEEVEEEECEHKSFSKYRIDEIDFFLNTLEVRGDAISCYKDYNNDDKPIFYDADIEALKEEMGESFGKKEEVNYLYVDEKEKNPRITAYIERLKNQGVLASLKETLLEIVETAPGDREPSWAKYRLEELDFFFESLDIRKDAIPYYGDYHNNFQSIFEHSCLGSFHDSKDSVFGVSSSSGSSGSSESSTEEDRSKNTRCTICSQFILKRNLQVERVAKIFFDI